MHRNIRLLIAYEGTEFHGWQKQLGLRTVQGVLDDSVRRVVRHPTTLIGSGRTDAGVHAAGQVANFATHSTIPAGKLFYAIGSRLPKDVTLRQLIDVPLAFHANRSARTKLYRYIVHNAPGRPVEHLRQRYTYHFWDPLDLDAMREGAAHLVGTRDFAAMASSSHKADSTVRTGRRVDIYRRYREIFFDVVGEGFLYNQVRNIVGTLIEVGRGHWPAQRVAEIMASGERKNAGPTAPARGLSLQWVRYSLPGLRRTAAEAAQHSPPDAAPEPTEHSSS